MQRRFLKLLRCPECRAELRLDSVAEGDERAIVVGQLACTACAGSYPIRHRIPRFVPETDYVDSFGWQWNRFAKLQRDSYNGTTIGRDTILKRSGWAPARWAGKTVLECGCGSGSDTEVLLDLADTVVGFDLSRAVDAFRPDLLASKKLLVLRADLLKIPLETKAFDIVYCHRVIQHTPDPRTSLHSMVRHVRPGGSVLVHSYSRHWKSLLNYKYVWRGLTRRLPHRVVYRCLRIVGPALYVLHGILNRLAFLRRLNRLAIPFEYHTRMLRKAGSTLTRRECYEYSFLITFDALTPRYDNPSQPMTLRSWCLEERMEDVRIQAENPVIVTCRAPA